MACQTTLAYLVHPKRDSTIRTLSLDSAARLQGVKEDHHEIILVTTEVHILQSILSGLQSDYRVRQLHNFSILREVFPSLSPSTRGAKNLARGP